jgi:ectoine hydroxylase-related dioxygenase (phytanoyl-CoA dioxygenase family)
MSAFLTLQGAVAHCDMPVESGTTMLLPHSQRYPLGYVAWRNPEVKKYFAEHMVQLPLEKGDVVYFSPALLHGAGTNHTSDVQRMANLLQVSSAFGRAMESLNRLEMCEITYPVLAEKAQQADWNTRDTRNVVAACAEGYSFPTNLDSDQPIGGLAPITQAEVMLAALQRGASADEATADLRAQYRRTLP